MNAISALQALETIRHLDRRRKTFQKRVDPFDLPDAEFKMRYRFSKTTVNKIIELIKSDFKEETRGGAISLKLQLLVALRCWGRREVQDDTGELHGISQPSVSRICARIARALGKLAPTLICMPQSLSETNKIAAQFRAIRNFPGVIGAIDCTHIRIKKCGGDLAQYYINRKGFYSLNVQAICDAQLRFRNIVARWRGSTHDSRIFSESVVKNEFERGIFRGRLLGDSGYRLRPYLYTPILSPINPKEERYNAAHIATRNTVERCFGVWKQRFRCLLSGLTVSLENAKTAIIALAVLHNIAINEKEDMEVEVGTEEVSEEPVINNSEAIPDDSGNRRLMNMQLRAFIDEHF